MTPEEREARGLELALAFVGAVLSESQGDSTIMEELNAVLNAEPRSPEEVFLLLQDTISQLLQITLSLLTECAKATGADVVELWRGIATRVSGGQETPSP